MRKNDDHAELLFSRPICQPWFSQVGRLRSDVKTRTSGLDRVLQRLQKEKAPLLATLILGLALVGCGSHNYEDARPPTDVLVDGNDGLQSKDVGAATDKMVNSLLSLPELNASDKQWIIVLDKVENNTTDPLYSYEAFTQRLRSRISQLGHGRITLVENKEKYHALQNQELEQSSNGGSPNLAGVQPQYALYITINQLANRASDYYGITEKLVNLQTRTMWESPEYEVQTTR